MTARDTIQAGHVYDVRAPNTAVSTGYQVHVSHESQDPGWDAFLAETPGGHHLQTSLWAQVKALHGWRVARIVIRREGQIVAGAQLLIRPLPMAGAIAYVPRGPFVAWDDPVLDKLVIDTLHQVVKEQRLQYLAVQPPGHAAALASRLPARGFRPSSVELAPTATVILDLTLDLDEILAQMKKKTRYNVRLGQRKGIVVREGTERDLPAFYRLLLATSRRQQFSPESEPYFTRMWRLLEPHGYVKLFVAESGAEAVSAALVVPFGDTVIYKRGGWSGHYGGHCPNEVMHWSIIKWAKANGYHYYDLEGIDTETARRVINGEPLENTMERTVTSFKLGFGGQVTVFPGAYEYVYNPVVRWAYNTIYPRIAGTSWGLKVVNLMRGGS